MTDAPLMSEDGHWWWDETAQQWQPAQGAAAADGGHSDRAAARVAAGLPASLHELTDEQRDAYLAEPTVYAESEVADVVAVAEMHDEESA